LEINPFTSEPPAFLRISKWNCKFNHTNPEKYWIRKKEDNYKRIITAIELEQELITEEIDHLIRLDIIFKKIKPEELTKGKIRKYGEKSKILKILESNRKLGRHPLQNIMPSNIVILILIGNFIFHSIKRYQKYTKLRRIQKSKNKLA
jgi:hypothetical protein